MTETSAHVFPWKWFLADIPKPPDDAPSVFSCFSCGGGSSMGYKLAGFRVLGNIEIDKNMMDIYRKNLAPSYPYLIDIRDFLSIPKEKIPVEICNLDVLDGSPPCSVFSTIGEREKGWGMEKRFAEGQKLQRLDDLFLYFIRVAEKLKPKIVIAENVQGLLIGRAKGYVNEIIKAFRQAGYGLQLFDLDAQYMGVPQRRRRCFFIARRADLQLPNIKLCFSEKPILFNEVRAEKGREFVDKNGKYALLLSKRRLQDKSIADIKRRTTGKKGSAFGHRIVRDDFVCPTITASANLFRMHDGLYMNEQDYINVQTFPQDYDFCGRSAQYVCGMSVPPVMMAQIARQVRLQWIDKL